MKNHTHHKLSPEALLDAVRTLMALSPVALTLRQLAVRVGGADGRLSMDRIRWAARKLGLQRVAWTRPEGDGRGRKAGLYVRPSTQHGVDRMTTAPTERQE